MVRSTLGRPVELIDTTRSWLPSDGVARHTVSVAAAVTPTPVAEKLMLVTLPDIMNPSGNFFWAWTTTPSSRSTTQPSAQSPVQVLPSDEAHSLAGLLRLIASLRANCALATKSLASEVSLLLNVTSWKDGTAIASKIANTEIVTIISIRVKPDSASDISPIMGRFPLLVPPLLSAE